MLVSSKRPRRRGDAGRSRAGRSDARTCAIGRSRAVRPARRRSRRSGQAGRRQGRQPRSRRPIRDRDQILQVAGSASRRALYQLGRAYAANRQMPEAIAAWRKAADKGSTSAMVELGVLYATGAGVAKDDAASAKAVRARRRGRQSARRHQSRRAVRRRRCAGRSGTGPRNLLAKAAETNSPKRNISSA